MIEVDFHKDLYDGFAVDEAARVYERFATFERSEEPTRWVLRVTGPSQQREERIALELANYALGLTIERQGKNGGAP